MKILIACEHTGAVRDAFTALGHDATSCDLLPAETPGSHYQGNVLDILYEGWDLMVAHPPCTYLSFAATKYWNVPGRARKRLEALDFFLALWEAPIEKICIENPLGCADSIIAKHTQIIHPYYFGDNDLKRTCLWLKGLPKLTYTLKSDLFGETKSVKRPEPVLIDKSGKRRYYTDMVSSGSEQWRLRSRTFPGIAKAMAEQWGEEVLVED